MLSVVIPTCNSEEGLARTLASLVPAAAEGVVREVIVADGGSRDGTRVVAEAAGCTLVRGAPEWGGLVDAGVAAARRGPWLMIMSPGVVLEGDWFREVSAFVERAERGGRAEHRVATFRLVFDDYGWRPRIAESVVGFVSGLLGRPVRDQALVVSRRQWDRLRAGHAPRSHTELVGRIARRSVRILRANAVVLAKPGETAAAPSFAEVLAMVGHGFGLPIRSSRL